jgi:hypothetical protein
MANKNIIPESRKLEIISLYFHNDLSVQQINKRFNNFYTEKKIARVIAIANMEMERYIIIESKMNYTSNL